MLVEHGSTCFAVCCDAANGDHLSPSQVAIACRSDFGRAAKPNNTTSLRQEWRQTMIFTETALDGGGFDFQSRSRPAPRGLRSERSRSNRKVSLALQGGGAFGAFTWGVLDRLLEANLSFDAVSGASAGAMNAVLLASGLARGGPDEARASLERFWHKVSEAGRQSRLLSSNPVLTRVTSQLSPYQFNPFDLNPLRDILSEEVDLEAVRTKAPVRLLLGTTRVSDGALRVFRNKELSYDVVLASACLPHLHQAVSIDGEPHWDGGYAANPPLLPLVTATRTSDLLIVQIIPANYSEVPTTSPEIDKRLNQITFNSSLQKDLEALSMMTRLCQEGDLRQSPLGR
jgi:NTE family protein